MARREQRLRRRQRAHQYLARWQRTHAHAESDAQSYISITQQSKTELDHYGSFAASNTVSLGKSPSVSVSLAGLPSYEMAVPPPQRGPGEHQRIPSIKKAMLMYDRKPPMTYIGGSFSLKPNRRTDTGDVELGVVLTESQVELARARSKRSREVSSLVHQWRSPIGEFGFGLVGDGDVLSQGCRDWTTDGVVREAAGVVGFLDLQRQSAESRGSGRYDAYDARWLHGARDCLG